MDGLSVAVPIGDSNYANLRGDIAIASSQALKLDSDFGLHPRLDGDLCAGESGPGPHRTRRRDPRTHPAPISKRRICLKAAARIFMA